MPHWGNIFEMVFIHTFRGSGYHEMLLYFRRRHAEEHINGFPVPCSSNHFQFVFKEVVIHPGFAIAKWRITENDVAIKHPIGLQPASGLWFADVFFRLQKVGLFQWSPFKHPELPLFKPIGILQGHLLPEIFITLQGFGCRRHIEGQLMFRSGLRQLE